MSARIDENGVKTKKLWLKQGSKDLFAIDLNFQGLALKKPGTKTKLNLNYRARRQNRAPGRRVQLVKITGAKTENKGLVCKYFSTA